MFNNDKVTCISPWYEIRIDTNGSLRACHAFRSEFREHTDLSFLEWFNKGKVITQVRNEIRNGVEVKGCKSCYDVEELGIVSFRERRNLQAAIYHNEYFKESFEQSPAKNRLTNNTDNIKPAFIHVSLSNHCNSSCRMCFPTYSSHLTTNLKKINELPENHTVLEQWSNDDEKWQNFLELIKDNQNLLSLHFMGGEPLLHKRFYEFVDWAIENNQTNYYLTFVTNGTIYNKDLFQKLEKFKTVHLELSVENFGLTNNYIRIDSTYNEVLKNYKLYKNHAKSLNFTIVLRTVPQALSIKEYHTVIDFALKNDLAIDNNVLTTPEFLKIVVLPKDLKKEIKEFLSKKYSKILKITDNEIDVRLIRHPGLQRMRIHIENIINFLDEEEPKNIEQLRAKFIQHNIKMDKFSKLKFSEIYPELVDFYEKYNKI